MKLQTPIQDAGIRLDAYLAGWMAQNSVLLTRIALGLVFFWFGVLKFFPGQSDAERLAGETITKLSFGHILPAASLPILATWECLIGLGLLTGWYMRGTLILLFLQMPGTFLPLFFFPAETWKHVPYAPTLLGQYIIKNLVLLCAGLLVGGTMRGGRVIAEPDAAHSAHRLQNIIQRFRRRFGTTPDRSPGPRPRARILSRSRI